MCGKGWIYCLGMIKSENVKILSVTESLSNTSQHSDPTINTPQFKVPEQPHSPPYQRLAFLSF